MSKDNVKPRHHSDPALGGAVINYSSVDQDFTFPVRGILLGTAGTLKVDMSDGTTLTFSNLLAGILYPLAIKRIYHTGSSGAAGNVLR